MPVDEAEWRCERFLELDRLIETEERQVNPGHRRNAGPGWRAARRRRLAEYAAKMRAGMTPATQHRQRFYTKEQRRLIATGVPCTFFDPPESQ